VLLVVHIPKTAGTSLRQALVAQFGKRRVACDYGAESTATSREIMTRLYASGADRDIPALVAQLRAGGCEALVGHFPVTKYAVCFQPERIISLMREPLARMASEYLHRHRQGRYEGTFSEFIEEPWFRNMQSGMLHDRPERMFIGLAEQYRESLDLINQRFGLNLAHKKRNRGPKGGGLRLVSELRSDVIERFHSLNQADVALYRDAWANFVKLSGSRLAQRELTKLPDRLNSGAG